MASSWRRRMATTGCRPGRGRLFRWWARRSCAPYVQPASRPTVCRCRAWSTPADGLLADHVAHNAPCRRGLPRSGRPPGGRRGAALCARWSAVGPSGPAARAGRPPGRPTARRSPSRRRRHGTVGGALGGGALGGGAVGRWGGGSARWRTPRRGSTPGLRAVPSGRSALRSDGNGALGPAGARRARRQRPGPEPRQRPSGRSSRAPQQDGRSKSPRSAEVSCSQAFTASGSVGRRS